MKKLTRADVLTNEEYLRVREDRRKNIIALKKLRRIEVGSQLCFTFENRDTVIYQIQEMMRVEHIADEEKIQFEIDTYNDLIPGPGSLSATMFIQIEDRARIQEILDKFQGLDQTGTVALIVSGDKCFASFEPGHSKEDRISAVHYLTFPLTENQLRNFAGGEVLLEVRHPYYMAKTSLTAEQRQEIARDLDA